MRRLPSFLCIFVFLAAGIQGRSRIANAGTIKSDFVFLIDATSSMAGEIAGVRNGFASFISGLNTAQVDARFAVVVFGGAPELILDFTSDQTDAQNALNSIMIGSNPGNHNNHNVNPEASLEAIRMALLGAVQNEFVNNNIPQDGILNYRSGARKNLILATDEDSDRPSNVANRFPGQTGNEPPSSFNANWQAEVDATAQAVINNDAFLNMLINRSDNPSRYQYGDYLDDVSDSDFLNFDKNATLTNLLADPITDNSLQAQVLQAGLIARTFNVQGANNSDFVDNFFAAKVQEVIENPVDPIPDPVNPIPEPTSLAIFGIGALGLVAGGIRRRKQKRTE